MSIYSIKRPFDVNTFGKCCYKIELTSEPVKLGVHWEFWHGGTARWRKSPRQ